MSNIISGLAPPRHVEQQSRNDNAIPNLIELLKAATLKHRNDDDGQSRSAGTNIVEHAERLRLLETAKELVASLENPEIAVLEVAKWPAAHAVFRTALRMKVFDVLGDGEIVTAETLASLLGMERLLAIRMMRTLIGIGIFSEAGEDQYRHNRRSIALKHPAFCTFASGLSETTVIMPKLPDFLATLHYQNPGDRHHALFQYAYNTNLNFFEWMQHHPEQLARFSATMAASTRLQAPILEAIILSLLPQEPDAPQVRPDAHQDVLLVDVGGGRGEVISSVRDQRPDLQGRIIVQDLPQEIAGRAPAAGIEAMAHDFFTPQPVTGAHVYFFCHIFHDWPDAACRHILQNTVPVLTPGKSKLVIVDIVVPEVGASLFTCMMDVSMMAFGGMERTERQWRGLLEGAGLRVVGIEGPRVGSLTGDSVIVAEVVDG